VSPGPVVERVAVDLGEQLFEVQVRCLDVHWFGPFLSSTPAERGARRRQSALHGPEGDIQEARNLGQGEPGAEDEPEHLPVGRGQRADSGRHLATLYRNFRTREDLIEAVYVAEVDALCRYGEELQDVEPWAALVAWVRRFVIYMATKRVLLDVLDRESGAFRACRDALYESGAPLLARAQEAGAARADVNIDDVLRFLLGVTGAPFGSDEQRDRILEMAIDGIGA
jgi:hypothetical protein